MILEVTFLTFRVYSQRGPHAAIVTVGFHQQIISARTRKAIKVGILVIWKIYANIEIFHIRLVNCGCTHYLINSYSTGPQFAIVKISCNTKLIV